MSGKFAYSYNGENYIGRYDTRPQALAEAIKRVESQPERPQSIYVARLHTIDPKLAGHGDAIIREMRRSAIADIGDGGDEYLRRATGDQVKELDREISNVVHTWLQRHELTSNAFRAEEISERPVAPPADTAKSSSAGQNEVHDLGPTEATIGQ